MCTNLEIDKIHKQPFIRVQEVNGSKELINEIIDNHLTISFKNNFIKYLYNTTFTKLMNLQVIDLSNNKLETIVPGLFKKNNLLEYIDLSNNSIVWIQGSWMHLGKLKSINVRNNKLTTYNRLIYKKFMANRLLNKQLLFSNNNFNCDCDILWLIKTNRYFENIFMDPDVMCHNNTYNFTEMVANSPLSSPKFKNASILDILNKTCSYG